MNEAKYKTLSRTVRVTDHVRIGASSVHLQDEHMHILFRLDAGLGLETVSYMTVAQARELAAALIEVADQYEAVRQQAAA